MNKYFILATTLVSSLSISACADEHSSIGVVNFSDCINESKVGKQEQEKMKNIRDQLSSLIETSEKELRELTAKFEDPEYLDSLSPKAEEELKLKYQALQEDLARYQQQFYQVLNHANYQMVQKMSLSIAEAAKKIAQEKQLDYVINREACFYIRDDFDVTHLVVLEMDKLFDQEGKMKQPLDDDVSLNATDEASLNQAG